MTTIDHGAHMALVLPPVRDEFELPSIIEPAADVECPLPMHIRILQSSVVRRLVAHDRQATAAGLQREQDRGLQPVRVLIFVDQDMVEASADVVGQRPDPVRRRMRPMLARLPLCEQT